jgi:hypothetical protein
VFAQKGGDFIAFIFQRGAERSFAVVAFRIDIRAALRRNPIAR